MASVQAIDDADLHRLDHGEKEAITLALDLRANLLLMDDREGATATRRKGLAVIGTLGVLDAAARQGLTDIGAVVTRLKRTNFRYPPELMDELILRYRKGEAS